MAVNHADKLDLDARGRIRKNADKPANQIARFL